VEQKSRTQNLIFCRISFAIAGKAVLKFIPSTRLSALENNE
jgi:hypothetical protein